MKELLDLLSDFADDLMDSSEDELGKADLSELDLSDAFMDHDSLFDQEAVKKVSDHYGLNLSDSEEFLEVLQAIQHGVGDLSDTETIQNIDDYIDSFKDSPRRVVGLINNIKGLYGEHEVYEKLVDMYGDDVAIARSYNTNMPGVDFVVFDKKGEVLEKIQVKITGNSEYVQETAQSLDPSIKIVTTDNVLEKMTSTGVDIPENVFGLDLNNEALTGRVERTIRILQETEPEFDLLVKDPILSEHIEQQFVGSESPFGVGGNEVGRRIYADAIVGDPSHSTYSSFGSDVFATDTVAHFQAPWDDSCFKGVGEPLKEGRFWKMQQDDFSCAQAVQRNIYESLTGIEVTENEVCKFSKDEGIYHPNRGTLPDEIGEFLSSQGLDVQNEIYADFDQLHEALEKNKKVMVGLDANEIDFPRRSLETGNPIEHFIPRMHCVQVTGIDYSDPHDPVVLISDPGRPDGAVRAIAKADFLNAWEDGLNRMTVVSK